MPLSGKRILIVEDEFLIALMAADTLTDLGATPVGPAHTVALGLELAQNAGLDGALLDVNIKGQESSAIAQILNDRGVPFVLVTGQATPAWAPDAPRLDKPFTGPSLVELLERLFPVPA